MRQSQQKSSDSAEMFKKPLWQTVWTQIRLLQGAVCPGSTLFASMLNSSVMLGNYLQQTTFSDAFFLGALRVKPIFSHADKLIIHYIKEIIALISLVTTGFIITRLTRVMISLIRISLIRISIEFQLFLKHKRDQTSNCFTLFLCRPLVSGLTLKRQS